VCLPIGLFPSIVPRWIPKQAIAVLQRVDRAAYQKGSATEPAMMVTAPLQWLRA
jgi:hypothetical protein